MHPDLHRFLLRLAGVVAISLLSVAFIAFVSMPLNMGRHPGDAQPHGVAPLATHMS